MAGPYPKFSELDVFKSFLLIENIHSRGELVKSLGLGEGVVKSILKILKNKGLVVSTKRGHFLSKKGELYLRKVKKKLIWIPSWKKRIESIEKSKKSVCIVFYPKKNFKVYELRDLAVKAGADGALIFKMERGKLLMPPDKKEREEYKKLKEEFPLKGGSLLIISFSSGKGADNGSLNVGINSCEEIRKIYKLITG